YFLYNVKTDTGEPLKLTGTGAIQDCTETSTPSDPAEDLCKCTGTYAPTGCWMEDCSQVLGGTPGVDCKQFCRASHILGVPEPPATEVFECLPLSVFYCNEPGNSQDTSADPEVEGVDVFDFRIGVARRDRWDPSLGVVQAASE
ncbi:MAG: hypothetical protein KC466_16805, partial [Myxococcales bacterium]|nr:hypothetical protein [Myxococcales bacterium]